MNPRKAGRKRSASPDSANDAARKKSSSSVVVREWSRSSDYCLAEIYDLIENSGSDMDVPPNIRRFVEDGRLKVLTIASSGALVGALVYGTFRGGCPPFQFPHPTAHRSQLYFIAVSVKGQGYGKMLLEHWEKQAELEGVAVLQVVPAKEHLIGQFYKNYQCDQQLKGGSCISKWVARPPTSAQVPQSSPAHTSAEESVTKPWQAFLQGLKSPQTGRQAGTPPGHDHPELSRVKEKTPLAKESDACVPQWHQFMAQLQKDNKESNVKGGNAVASCNTLEMAPDPVPVVNAISGDEFSAKETVEESSTSGSVYSAGTGLSFDCETGNSEGSLEDLEGGVVTGEAVSMAEVTEWGFGGLLSWFGHLIPLEDDL